MSDFSGSEHSVTMDSRCSSATDFLEVSESPMVRNPYEGHEVRREHTRKKLRTSVLTRRGV